MSITHFQEPSVCLRHTSSCRGERDHRGRRSGTIQETRLSASPMSLDSGESLCAFA